ncbi:MAG: hypothetical protein JXR84_20810 [Anaerolineae bacterium]|nr:hypothetical protein [Anaerolineae bacterium]
MANMRNGEFIFESELVVAHVEELNFEAMFIVARLNKHCPCLSRLKSEVISEIMRAEDRLEIVWPKIVDHPTTRLLTYLNSIHNTCWQVLYSMERLSMLSNWVSLPGGAGSIMDHFISYYFSGFVAEVKATTDILGLMVNHLFELNIERKRCGLEKGVVSNKLFDKVSDSSSDKHMIQLSYDLEQARTYWIKDFYDLRNVVTHRDEMWPSTLGIRSSDANDTVSIVPDFRIYPNPHNPQLLDYAKRVSPFSIVSYEFVDDFIDPLKFCVDVWKKTTVAELTRQEGKRG